MFLVLLFLTSVNGDPEPTTTKTYDIDVPGSDPIRIIEGESLWKSTPKSNSEHRALFVTKNDDSDNPLHQFLTTYADTVKRNKFVNKNNKDEQRIDNTDNIDPSNEQNHRLANLYMGNTEKTKSWDLINYQKHNHPYDDKRGWVSMEPVPWSVSKISKWESKYKPSPKPWEDDYESVETFTRPSWNKPTNHYDYLETKPSARPVYAKPTAIYGQKVHLDYNNKKYHKHDENCRHSYPQRPHDRNDENDDEMIITDGLPANFPKQYEANRRKSTEIHPDSHPFSGEGDWVLLSTTKGYKYPPNRQRSLQISPDSLGAHRGVRLTVLPPLRNSKVNMTTSHGGLLQVEQTFQTVEQAHKQFSKKEKLKKRRPQPVFQKFIAPVTTTTNRKTSPDSSALLAAVGAGMIPATMAMLLPVALGGRRKREVQPVTSVPTLQITLPRNLY